MTYQTNIGRYGLVSLLLFVAAGCMVFALQPLWVGAETEEELRQKISDSEEQLKAIEEEIKKFEAQLNEVGAEKKTLQSAIRELDISRRKILAEIGATEKKISSTDLEIQELQREIRVKELEITRNKAAMAASFRTMDEMERQTFVEMLLAHDSIAEVWDMIASQSMLQASLREDVRALMALKTEYERAKGRTESKREELGELHSELSGRETSLSQTKDEKDQLLTVTENEEANYERLLAEKNAAKEQFEAAMREYEAQLQFILDPNSIPAAGSGVLRWPFEPSYMYKCKDYNTALGNTTCLTQYFGNTAFAQQGAYNGRGHNGIDFRAPIGTKITAALGGTVQAVNTIAAPNCQYGKWVLVKHGNGLTTLYAHLSSLTVSNGQTVRTGDTVGFSGATGYATGPHLHLTVYASDAVNFKEYTCRSGPTVTVPISAYAGYLNPLDYL